MCAYSVESIWPEWQVEAEIGRGTSGVVYKVFHRDTQRRAAVKIISVKAGENAAVLKKHVVERIQLMISMRDDPHIVHVEDYMVTGSGTEGWQIYERMEFLTSLDTYCKTNPLYEKDVLKIGQDIAAALVTLEKHGVIHGDIKPENIFVDAHGTYRLGDFGSAVLRGAENCFQSGTANYMTPEALAGQPAVSQDTYALSLVLYQLLNHGHLPFIENDLAETDPAARQNALKRRMNGEAFPVPVNASAQIANMIMRGCAFESSLRYHSAKEMYKAIGDVFDGMYQLKDVDTLDRTQSVRKAVQPSPVLPIEKKEKPKKGKKNFLWILAALVLLIGVGAGIYFIASSADQEETSAYSAYDEEKITEMIAEADRLADEGDFEGAIASIQAGLVTYPDEERLQEKLEEYQNRFEKEAGKEAVEEALEQAESLAKGGDYAAAIAILDEADDSLDSDELKDARRAYCDEYKEQVLKEADRSISRNDYANAQKMLSAAIAIIGEDEELEEKLESLNSESAEEVLYSYSGMYYPDGRPQNVRSFDLFIKSINGSSVTAQFTYYNPDGTRDVTGIYNMEGDNYTENADGTASVTLNGTTWVRVPEDGSRDMLSGLQFTFSDDMNVVTADEGRLFGKDNTVTGQYDHPEVIRSYTGTYRSNWGETGMDLVISSCDKDTGMVEAECTFYPVYENSRAKTGSYTMAGRVFSENADGSVTLVLMGDEWLNKPADTSMIDFYLTVGADGMTATSDQYDINLHAQ